MKLIIVLTFCLGFVACIPDPRDRVMIIYPGESGPAPMPKSHQSGPAAPEETSYKKIFEDFLAEEEEAKKMSAFRSAPRPKKKFFRQFWTGSGNTPRLIGYNPQPGSILVRAGNPVTPRPYDPYVPPDPRLQKRSYGNSWGSGNKWGWGK